MTKLNIAVLAGGPSAERDISLMGGRAVADALAGLGHAVTFADVGPDNLAVLDTPGLDVVFPVLHGPWGEDGQIQRILEARGLPYVGSGPAASALAMDKVASKAAFVNANLPTPAWQVWSKWPGDYGGPFPVVAKPIDQGSSVDLTIAHTTDELREAVARICQRYGRCMVEEFISGRELTVGVLDGATLPPIEIVVHGHEFYDYQAKYFDDTTEYRMDPVLPAGVRGEMIRLAREAHAALGCRDFSRVDILLREDNGPFILEINTIPGFTGHSLVPKAAAHVGLNFAALCDRLIGMAMARKKDAGTRRRRDAGTKRRGEGAMARGREE